MSASASAADLCFLDATALAGLIRSREVSPVGVVRALRARAESVNPLLNAVVDWAPDAEAQARAAERALAPGGVQLIGARLADATVLHAGAALDAVRPARDVRPDLG